jgi:hypothetical protein
MPVFPLLLKQKQQAELTIALQQTAGANGVATKLTWCE